MKNNRIVKDYLDTMGLIYLVKLIRANTASREELAITRKILRNKMDKYDVRIKGNTIIVNGDTLTVPDYIFREITRNEINIMFEK